MSWEREGAGSCVACGGHVQPRADPFRFRFLLAKLVCMNVFVFRLHSVLTGQRIVQYGAGQRSVEDALVGTSTSVTVCLSTVLLFCV